MRIQVLLSMAVLVTVTMLNGCATQGIPLASHSRKTTNKSNMQFSLARAQENEGNLGEALRVYEALYAQDHSNGQVCHRLGVVKLRMGQVDEGISYLMEANSIIANHAEIMGDIGYAYIQQGDFEIAEKFLRDSLDVDPSNSRTVNNLAMAVGYQGRMDECYTLYRSIVGDAEANSNLGYIYSQRGDTELAVKHYSKALDLNPSLKSAGEALVQIAEVDKQVQVAKAEKPKSKIQLASDTAE